MLVKNSLIAVAMRWTDRLIGLISTLVLARLLSPEDFGLIALATIVIGLVDTLFDFGVGVTLVQKLNPTASDYDAAFTLRLIQSVVATVIVLVAAPFAAKYFGDPRIEPVVAVLAISIFISGFENIGIVTFQKELKFASEFRFFFFRRLSGVAATFIAAYFLRSYWALVYGAVTARAVGVVLSYLMHPMRPRVALKGMRGILGFSIWNLVRSLGGFLNNEMHKALAGRAASASVVGSYSMAMDIAALPSSELLAPINRVLLPHFSALQNEPEALAKAFTQALGVQCMIAMPAATGLAAVATEIVPLLLGDKWLSAIELIQVFCLINVLSALSVSGAYLLLSVGKARVTAINVWLQVILYALGAWFFSSQFRVIDYAWLRLIVAIAGCGHLIFLASQILPGGLGSTIARTVWRPICASAVMLVALTYATSYCEIRNLVALLAFKIALGAIVFIATIYVLWQISGTPEGSEQYVMRRLQGFKALRKNRR